MQVEAPDEVARAIQDVVNAAHQRFPVEDVRFSVEKETTRMDDQAAE